MDTFNASPMPAASLDSSHRESSVGRTYPWGFKSERYLFPGRRLCVAAAGDDQRSRCQGSYRAIHSGSVQSGQENPKVKGSEKGQSVQKGSVRIRGNTRVKTSHMDTIEPKPQKSVHIRSNDHRRSQTLDVQQESRSVEGQAVTIVGNPNVDGSTGDQLNAIADEAKKKGSDGKARRKTKKRAKTRNPKSRRRSR